MVGSKPLKWDNTEFAQFTATISALKQKRDFAGLDAVAERFRKTKERFTRGGGWKIHSLYSELETPASYDEQGWQDQIRFLNDWKQERPSSIVPRVALTQVYIHYAWEARGENFSEDVPESAWPVVNERLAIAAAELKEASSLAERCYGYFEAMLTLARITGWDSAEFERAYADAVAYDKTYQYFLMSKAENLLQRWGGRPGELLGFAESLEKSFGEREGLKLYYMVVTQIFHYGYKGGNAYEENGLSWRKTKRGFVFWEEDHGATRYRVSEFAAMAFKARDSRATCNTFSRIADPNDIDMSAWPDAKVYAQQKALAMSFMCKVPNVGNQVL
jgi:hypothetical protein